MSESLFSILKPLVDYSGDGSLMIQHKNGDQASILLNGGRITGIKVGNLTGAEAGKALSMWLSFSTKFSDDTQTLDDNVTGLNTQHYLSFLEQIAQWADKIQELGPLNGVNLRLVTYALKGKNKYNAEELKIFSLSTVRRRLSRLFLIQAYQIFGH